MKSKWIWYPCEFEINIANRILFKRDYRGEIEPPFWKIDGLYYNVFFFKKIELSQNEDILIKTDSIISVMCDYKKFIKKNDDDTYTLPKGSFELCISAYNKDKRLPTIFVSGKTINSDETWFVSNVKHRGEKIPVGYSDTLLTDDDPNNYSLETKEIEFLDIKTFEEYFLYDFGKETFGYIKLYNVKGHGEISIYYGESIEEAEDIDRCETFDVIKIEKDLKEYIHNHSRGFRFAKVIKDKTVSFEKMTVLYEYLPVEYRGEFKSSSDTINNIFDVSLYTFHLNSREVFLDGIKRDRWCWAGDAYQSYLYNYYSFFDKEIVHRTTCALRGKGCINHHINQILDYTFYWFIGLYDYYIYMGDVKFLKSIFKKAIDLMDFCLSIRTKEGFIEGRGEKDWVFVDWSDMPKDGALSAEQILFYRSLWVMAKLSNVLGYNKEEKSYKSIAKNLKDKIFEVFYDEKKGIFYHNSIGGKANKHITRYANIFAIMYDLVDDKQKDKIIKNVLLNDNVQKIVTPYAMFYELVGLCEAKKLKEVTDKLKSYWGGMLKLGATTFWELYDPEAKNHLEMYGRPYGKSLCHAWGSNPIYILGRYYLGVYPTKPGYKKFFVEPNLGGLEWIEGKVPTPNGDIEVYMDKEKIRINNQTPHEGILVIKDTTIEAENNNIKIEPNKETEVIY